MTSANTATKRPAKKATRKRTVPTGELRRHGGRGGKYPWEKIEEAFIFGIPNPDSPTSDDRKYLNLRELGEHFDVPYARVREHSTRKRWMERRQAEQTKLAIERQKARNERLVGESVQFDERSLSVAKVGMGMVQARLAEIATDMKNRQSVREAAMERLKSGQRVERFELFSAINYKEMEALGRAAQMYQDIGRKALGTDIEHHEVSGTVEIAAISITDEMMRDDPQRLAELLQATQRAGLLEVLLPSGTEGTGTTTTTLDVVDAELVGEVDEQDEQDTE